MSFKLQSMCSCRTLVFAFKQAKNRLKTLFVLTLGYLFLVKCDLECGQIAFRHEVRRFA